MTDTITTTEKRISPVEQIIGPTLDLQPALDQILAHQPAPDTNYWRQNDTTEVFIRNGRYIVKSTDTAPDRNYVTQLELAQDASVGFVFRWNLSEDGKPDTPQLTAVIGNVATPDGQTVRACLDGGQKISHPQTVVGYFNGLLTYGLQK